MSDTKHTPTPWDFTTFTHHDGRLIQTVEDVSETVAYSARLGNAVLWGVSIPERDDEGRSKVICYTGNGPHSEHNAEFIVRACNAHEKLVEALEKAHAAFNHVTSVKNDGTLTVEDADRAVSAALALARGEQC